MQEPVTLKSGSTFVQSSDGGTKPLVILILPVLSNLHVSPSFDLFSNSDPTWVPPSKMPSPLPGLNQLEPVLD